jgi:hypothetical protein
MRYHPGNAGYEVFFTGDVSNGAFGATIGRPGIATEPPGEITVALRCCPGANPWTPFADNKGVWVQTFDSNGRPSDRSFHLIVLSQDMWSTTKVALDTSGHRRIFPIESSLLPRLRAVWGAGALLGHIVEVISSPLKLHGEVSQL